MFLNEDLSEYQKTKTSENFNPKITKIHQKFSNDICDPDDINDFCRFTDMININTFGSQPIIMYRKAKKLYSPKEEKRVDKKVVAKSQEKILINNYIKTNFIVDGGLPQKLNKYKSNMINVHSQSPINKNKKKFKSKTNRNTGNNKIRPKTQKAVAKNKEFIPKTAKTNIRKKNNINNNLNLKREKTNPNLKYNYKNNNKTKKNEKKQSNNNIIDNNIKNNNNNKYKSDKNTIENEKKQEKQKNDYMNDLIKNAIVGFTKELKKKKKNSENKKVTDRKLDYLLENGIDHNYEDELENGIVVMGKSKDKNLFKIKKIKPKKKIKIEKINTNNISNIDINYHTENDKFLYSNLTSSNNQILTSELSKNLTKNKNISSNNNLNIEFDMNPNKINNFEQELKKRICNPKIDQFEYLEKIRNNFKKIRNQKQKISPELINNSNSFKFSHLKKFTNKLVNKKQNNNNNNNIKINPKKNLQEIDNTQKNDEFLYADRVSHRTQTELRKFRKKKKMEQKKEQNEEMKKKQDKIMTTLQNLIKLGDEYHYNNNIINNSPLKIRNDSKNHVKKRKVLNEYYVGTEESKNNTSTFIDKQEYYKSIIESKNVLNYSKVEKTETNVDDFNNNNKILNNDNLRKLSSDNFYDINIRNNSNINNNKGFDNKLTELKAKVINTIKRSSELFNKENIKRIKSDLYENNNLIKTKFENKVFNKEIYKKKFMNNKIENINEERTEKNLDDKILSFHKMYLIFLKKRFLHRIKAKYNEVKSKEKLKKIKAAFEYFIVICKFYQYQSIINYNEKIKCFFALKKLVAPFIRHKFLNFINKLKYFTKIKFLVNSVSNLYKYKVLQKLFKYCAVVDFWKNIIIPGGIRLQHYILKKCFKKIKNEDKLMNFDLSYNVNRNIISRSYLHSHIINEEKKANSYIYESLDCADSISVHPNSLDNDGLHQLKEIIEMQNENRLEDSSLENGINEESGRMYGIRTNSNNSINTLDSNNNQIVPSDENSSLNDNNNNENQIKTEFHIKETLLKKIINNNDTVDKKK